MITLSATGFSCSMLAGYLPMPLEHAAVHLPDARGLERRPRLIRLPGSSLREDRAARSSRITPLSLPSFPIQFREIPRLGTPPPVPVPRGMTPRGRDVARVVSLWLRRLSTRHRLPVDHDQGSVGTQQTIRLATRKPADRLTGETFSGETVACTNRYLVILAHDGDPSDTSATGMSTLSST